MKSMRAIFCHHCTETTGQVQVFEGNTPPPVPVTYCRGCSDERNRADPQELGIETERPDGQTCPHCMGTAHTFEFIFISGDEEEMQIIHSPEHVEEIDDEGWSELIWVESLIDVEEVRITCTRCERDVSRHIEFEWR